MKVLLLALLAMSGAGAWGTDYYVSKNGNNSTGTSWATAWNECDKIVWSSVRPGDTIFIDGGVDSMVYTGSLIAGRAGDSSGRITLQRSTDPGRNGTVMVRHIEVKHPCVTIDGRRWGGMQLYTGGGRGIDVQAGADDFELKNVRVWSDFPGESTRVWGSLMYVWDGDVLIQNCEFFQTNAEDQIKYLAVGKKLTIEGCHFHGLKSTWCADTSYAGGGYMRHADCIQFEAVAQNTEFMVRRNIFTNLGVDCFMLAYADLDTVECSYNVFTRVADAIKLKSARHLYLYNNVFDRCRGDLCGGTVTDVQRNNIYTGRSWSGPVHINGSPQYSLWDTGTTYYTAGTGNQTANPLFVNQDNILGADGVPFTADDGFRLQTNSPARNAGIDLGFTRDIMGTVIQGTPDIGAYEYSTTGIKNAWSAAASEINHHQGGAEVFTMTGHRMHLKNTRPGGIYFMRQGKTLRKLVRIQ